MRVLYISPVLVIFFLFSVVISFVVVGFEIIIAILVGSLLKVGYRSLAVCVAVFISSFSCVCVSHFLSLLDASIYIIIISSS